MKRAPGAGRPRSKPPFSDWAVELGAAIKSRREKLLLSLEDLAERLKMSHQAISNIESGQTNPDDRRTRRTLERIAAELKDDFRVSWLRDAVKPEPEKHVIDIKARVAAGDAVEFFLEGDDTDSIEVDPRMIYKKGKYFGLRVDGESMVDAAILTGDVVIVRELSKGQKPRRDDIVVADIRAEGITLKRWTETDEEAILIPASKSHKPIRRERWRVKPVAVVVGVIRMIS